MKEHPVWYRVIGLSILIVPTLIYLCFLIPQLKEEYIILMSSGGIIGGTGMYAANLIPIDTEKSSLYKLAANSFTILTIITLVQEFIMELVFLVALFIVCFIIYKIFEGAYRNAREQKVHKQLATEITSSIAKNSK